MANPILSPKKAYASTTNPTITEKLYEIGGKSKMQNFSTRNHPQAVPNYTRSGIGTITTPIYYLLDLAKYGASSLAVIMVIVASLRLVGESTSEEAQKSRKNIMFGIIGLLFIQIADVAVKQMFFGQFGEAFSTQADAELFAEQTTTQLRGIIGFVQVLLGAGAVFTIVIRGFVVLASAGNEEAMSNARRHISYAIVGLIAVGLSELIIRGFIFPEQGSEMPRIAVALKIIADLTNYLSGIIALLAFISMFYAGYLYVFGFSNEENLEKAKKLIFGAVIGLILAIGAFALANTLLSFNKPPESRKAGFSQNYQQVKIDFLT